MFVQRQAICQLMALITIGFFATPSGAGEYANRIGITMVDIPAGSYLMGACKQDAALVEENKKRAFLGQAPLSGSCLNPDPDASSNEFPLHRVSVKKFQMSKTEVTLGQFKKFVVATGRRELIDEDFIKENRFGDNAPVVRVSWNDAQDFVRWLNSIDGGGYRLPSESEWEYACRAGEQHRYCGGNNVDEVAWHHRNSSYSTHPVAQKRPNMFGLFDMSGNASEWVQDCWHDSYKGAPSDEAAWVDGGCKYRVLRGGAWGNGVGYPRTTLRDKGPADFRHVDFGFRIARSR